MANNKIYLNVPYAQKDAAKALGARWDPSRKKWYVPAGVDMAPFASWLADVSDSPSVATRDAVAGVFTYASINHFMAYQGDSAPWD